jgi:hypothetical protein
MPHGLFVPGVAALSIGENQASRPDTVEMARASIRQMAARRDFGLAL